MEKINEKIKNQLEELNVNYEEQKNTVIKHLIKIESVLSDAENEYNSARETLAELDKNKLNLLSISKSTGISRQTLYNNPILKEYIEHACDTRFGNNPEDKTKDEVIKQLQSKIESLSEIIDKLQVRDVENEILRHKNKELKNTITNLKNTAASNIAQKEEIMKELNDLKKSLPKSSSTKANKKADVISVEFN